MRTTLPTGVMECEPHEGLDKTKMNGIVKNKTARLSGNLKSTKTNIKGKCECGEGLFMGPRRSEKWRARSNTMAGRWAKNGARLKLKRAWGRNLRVRGWHVPNRIPQDAQMLREKRDERDRQISTGNFMPCKTQNPVELVRRGCKISPAFMIRQRNKNRLNIDMRKLNSECEEKTLKLEQLKLVSRIAKRNWWFQSRDIRDGYGHVGIHADNWKLMVADTGKLMEGDKCPLGVY